MAYIDGKTVSLHRLALEKKLGRPIRKGMLALHTCHNRWCISEDHLYEGTHAQNMEDMKVSGRSKTCGRSASKRKLTDVQVKEIRRRLAWGESGRSLAKEFGAHEVTISKIKNRKSYL
jgi:hypothetical protein